MVRRSAERKRQPPAGQRRQKHVEQSGVFGSEQSREPAVVGVVDGQAGLNASEPPVASGERLDREAELVRFRPILRVENGDE